MREVLHRGYKDFFLALLVIALPNVFMFILSLYLGVSRPWVNFDYVVSSLFFMFFPVFVSSIVLVVFIVLDVLAVLGQLLPFVKFQDALYLLKFLPVSPLSYQVVAVAVFVISGFTVWIYARSNVWCSKTSRLFLVNIFVVVYLFSVTVGAEYRTDRIWRVVDGSAIKSQALFNIEARSIDFVGKFWFDDEPLGPAKFEGVSGALLGEHAVGEHLMLVVAESWGVSSPEIMKEVLAPLFDIREKFDSISVGEIPFEGVTLDGELRELCGLSSRHFNIRASNKDLGQCLPGKLRDLGYRTKAMHAAAGTMYDRAYWYPEVGFDEYTFFETRRWNQRCYSFPGGCDSELVDEVADFFSVSSEGFLYWLTLNSHFRYDERDILIDVFDCRKFDVSNAPQVCRNLKLQAQFFYNLAILLGSPEMDGVEVVVVGDHVPIISNTNVRDRFFKKNVVPWIKIST